MLCAQSDEWLKDILLYLKENLEYVKSQLKSMPHIKAMPIESTFLLWLDCKSLNLSDKQLEEFFIKEAKLGLNAGVSFGSGGEGFMRLNFATPRVILEKAMEQLKVAYEKRF